MNSKGVSVLLGFILLMLIGMIFLAVVQTRLVPSILKDVELKHENKVTQELYSLDSVITEGELSSVSLDLGVEYPKYPFLLTPQSRACSISVERFWINVSGFKVDGRDFVLNETSSRINITLNYFAFPNAKLVYENTAIFKVVGRINWTLSDQKTFGKGFLNVYIINATFNSFSSNRPVNLIVVPVSTPKGVRGLHVQNVNVEFYTKFPNYWERTLRSMGYSPTIVEENGNYKVSVQLNDVNVKFYYLYILKGFHTTVSSYEGVTFEKLNPKYMVKVGEYKDVDPIVVSPGQSVVLGVRVLDRFLNPLSNASVSVDVSGGIGTVDKTSGYTDQNGEFYVRFDAVDRTSTTLSGEVKFTCDGLTVVYNVTVTPTAGGNVTTPYTIQWENHEYVLTFMPWETQKSLEMRAYTTPKVVGVNVQFATDQSLENASFNPSESQTNDSGWVSSNLTVNDTVFGGSYLKLIQAYVLSWFSGDTAVVKAYKTLVWIVSDYLNFSRCYLFNTTVMNETGGDAYVTLKPSSNWLVGWSYRRPIYVQENSGNTLTDYQIKVVLDSTNFDFSKANPDGSDVRFTDSDGVTLLNYWIEEWDSVNQQAIIWVKVPLINASENKTIYMYYGNPNATFDSTHYGLTKVMTQLPASDGTGYTIYYEPWYMPSQLFTTTGTAMNWNGDDAVWTLDLPFSFPFYSTAYNTIYVCSNGYVGQYNSADWSSYVNELTSRNMIAPFWADLRTDISGYDIYVNSSYSDEFGSGVYIRWHTTFYYWVGFGSYNGEQNFAVVLYQNGLIRFDYGSIRGYSSTDDTPVIGVSYGDGTHYTLITTSDDESASNWNNHNSIMFWPRKKADTEPTVSVGGEQTPNYSTNGYVKSYVEDLGQNSTIYFLQWNGSLPASTEMSFYVRASNQSFDPNDSTPNWIFVGYASDGKTFDLTSKNVVGRYVQWMVYLNTTDNTETPILDEVVVGYLPTT